VIRAGRYRKRVAFERPDSTPDAYGNVRSGTWLALFTVWGNLVETSGRERIASGALAAPMGARLFVRSSSLTTTLNEADSAMIDGVRWNIRSITNPDGRNIEIEMVVERGAGN